MVMARFEVRPADIRSAALSASGFSPIFSWIGETAVAFSNGVTKASGPSPHPDYAAFAFALDVPSVVSRSTNELWHWSATSINGHELPSSVYIATNGPSVAYSILDEPVLPWTDSSITNQNVWISVLDFAMRTNACLGATGKKTAFAGLTQFLFSDHRLVYDVIEGRSAYILWRARENISFHLGSYMKRSRGSVVNCYDQACSLTLLGRCFGIEAEPFFMEPFGYIQTTTLVGGIPSNNPFFGDVVEYDPRPVCPINEPQRSGLANHMFTQFDNRIFDSCAGPVVGQWSLTEYMTNVIDKVTTNTLYKTGVETNAVPYSGIKEAIE